MTERFNLVGSYLYNGDECVSHFDDPKHRDEIVDLLNNLVEENEQLKISLSAFVEKSRRLQTILDKLGYEYIGDLK